MVLFDDYSQLIITFQVNFDEISHFETLRSLESEKQLMKERYLDDSSYAEMQAKHGLSYKALNMRLSRAKQKVRARVEKLLAGIGIFSWQDALEKMLLGGVEAVKISVKVKIITIGVAAVLVLGETGIILWHHQPTQAIPESTINQTVQKASAVSSAKSISSKKNISNEHINMLKDNQNEDAQKTQAIAFLDSLEKDSREYVTIGPSLSTIGVAKTSLHSSGSGK